MIQGGYCLVDLSFINSTDYPPGALNQYEDPKFAELAKKLDRLSYTGKVVLARMPETNQVQPITIQTVTNQVTGKISSIIFYRIQTIEEGGTFGDVDVMMVFSEEGVFAWQVVPKDEGGNG